LTTSTRIEVDGYHQIAAETPHAKLAHHVAFPFGRFHSPEAHGLPPAGSLGQQHIDAQDVAQARAKLSNLELEFPDAGATSQMFDGWDHAIFRPRFLRFANFGKYFSNKFTFGNAT
jgi:hypothetical protein